MSRSHLLVGSLDFTDIINIFLRKKEISLNGFNINALDYIFKYLPTDIRKVFILRKDTNWFIQWCQLLGDNGLNLFEIEYLNKLIEWMLSFLPRNDNLNDQNIVVKINTTRIRYYLDVYYVT